MQDLLEHFGVGHQPIARRHRVAQQPLGLILVRMRSPDEVHEDVRVDEDHFAGPRW